MPRALRKSTCKYLFDFATQRDACCDICITVMDPLTSQRRKKIRECDQPWSDKWCNHRLTRHAQRYQAAKKCLSEKPDVEVTPHAACPMVKPHKVACELAIEEEEILEIESEDEEIEKEFIDDNDNLLIKKNE